jgi:DNA-binding NarL/FixJ family response regulator
MALVGILLADETRFWRDFVSSVLRQDPCLEVIGEVSDGLRAVQMAERLQPAVVLLDVELPKLTGIQAGGWIRMLAPNTKIVFLAERLEADVVQAAMKLGPAGCTLKSQAARDLVAAIHAVRRGETFFRHPFAARLPTGPEVQPRTANEQPRAWPPVPEHGFFLPNTGIERAC